MSVIHLQGRNLIFIIKNLILATTIKKSQKKLKLKAKEWGCDKGQINIKIIKPSKKPKPPDLRNGIKARKRGGALGSNLDFLPVGWETPSLSCVSQFQARKAKINLLEDHPGEEAVNAAGCPHLL